MSKDKTNDNAKWYIISCYSGHEDKVAELIKQSVEANGMDHKVLDVMVPKQTKIVVQGGKKKEVDEKVFPGYVLVQMEIDDNTWQLIRSVEGVTKFIGGVKTHTTYRRTSQIYRRLYASITTELYCKICCK